ncbi:Aste57867_8750 [Aphanomyces stellatus]|uniref:Aste57867_8750 protein n=1 Tax=Aphanomyces stellatus TaxID=120398 RepID=A0A485KLG9_9STRA|nr:hypothetical protein As57867_008716 [Aphanomyces stellatus]VFT85636.1 Aste57867_8750 [Aphanomyces stellatus]
MELFEGDMWTDIFDDNGNECLNQTTKEEHVTPREWNGSGLSNDDVLVAMDENAHFPPHFGSPPVRYPLVTIPISSTSLSKPLCRHDGLVLVGNEQYESHPFMPQQHQLFVTNFRHANAVTMTASAPVTDMVRDLQWVRQDLAIAAVGKDVQLIHIGIGSDANPSPLQIQDPITTIHAKVIRELAVSAGKLLSGGFDMAVCVTNLERKVLECKYISNDVVSSVRWMPEAKHVSWTTDDGNLSIVDTRVRVTKAHVNFDTPSSLRFDRTGGLFSHEFMGHHGVVLAYEHGLLACLDIRKNNMQACYFTCQSPLSSIGEVRKSPSQEFAIFGAGGSVLSARRRANTCGRFGLVDFQHVSSESERWGMYGDGLIWGDTTTCCRGFACKRMEMCKTSGDFAMGNLNLMAVSDRCSGRQVYI